MVTVSYYSITYRTKSCHINRIQIPTIRYIITDILVNVHQSQWNIYALGGVMFGRGWTRVIPGLRLRRGRRVQAAHRHRDVRCLCRNRQTYGKIKAHSDIVDSASPCQKRWERGDGTIRAPLTFFLHRCSLLTRNGQPVHLLLRVRRTLIVQPSQKHLQSTREPRFNRMATRDRR